MYFYPNDSLGEPPRIPNPPLNQMCPLLVKDTTTGAFLDWQDYLNRTASRGDPISRKLADLRERQFIRESDYQNYVARCRDLGKTPQVVPPWLRGNAIDILKRTGVLRSPTQPPATPSRPVPGQPPPLSIDEEMRRFRRMVRGTPPPRPAETPF